MSNILTIYYDLESKKEFAQEDPPFFLSSIQVLAPCEIWDLLVEKKIFSQRYEEILQEAVQKFLSVDELLISWEENKKILYKTPFDADLAKICLITLWQKLYPETPCLELFEFFVQQGYYCLSSHKEEQALLEWGRAAKVFIYISQKLHAHGICKLREALEQNYEMDTWVQNYLSALLETYELSDLTTMQKFAQTFLQLFGNEDDTVIQSVKICYAQSFSLHQNYEKADLLYEKWLQNNPTWIQGWIAWADTYWVYDDGKKQESKAIFILKNALEKIFPQDRIAVLVRLQSLYQKKGLLEPAEHFAKEIQNLQTEQNKSKTLLQNDPLIEKLMQECDLTEEDFLATNFSGTKDDDFAINPAID